MVAPAPATSSFFPTSLQARRHLSIRAAHPRSSPSLLSTNTSGSASATNSPHSADCAPHHRQDLDQHGHTTRNQPQFTETYGRPASTPSPPPQQITLPLTLPPINVMTMSAVLSPHPTPDAVTPRVSMTSREWIIPPRPKPGRKPATDTPPTKRKAQNRAAQRAFRERRAARVGELEEQLQQQKEDQGKTEGELKEKIRGLEMELQSFRSRCLLLESMLERERKERIRAETEAESLRRNQYQNYSRPHDGHSDHRGRSMSTHQPERRDTLPQILPSLETNDAPSPTLTCGNCGPNACACAEEVLASVNSYGPSNDLKRPASPSGTMSSEKRQRSSLGTAELTPPTSDEPSHSSNEGFKDSCGFCKEGTYCVCADTAMATPAMTPTADTLPPISHQTQTPPPSEPDAAGPPQMIMEMTADGAVKLPPRRTQPRERLPSVQTISRGCGANGPGTCAQCQADPKSGLFCRLMAAKLGRDQGAGGCCGGKGADGGCCKSRAKQQQPQQPEKITLPSLPSLGLSCAEAYQTLSSHRHFDRASDDIGSWLPKLRAAPTPTPTGGSSSSSRKIMPMEVEAASIMSVLKDFDVRFGA